MIRVFPRRTKWIPRDDLAFVGEPTFFLPPEQPVYISVTFTWDIEEGERLQQSWAQYYPDVRIGGPAFNDSGGEFEPGRFIKEGVTITSRGCIRNCDFCYVPGREGKIRELEIKDGWIVEDNNLLACSQKHIECVFEMLSRQPERINFAGGFDVRLFKPWHVQLLKLVKLGMIWFAYDQPNQWDSLNRVANLLAYLPQQKKRCYLLCGRNGDTMLEAEKRLEAVFNLGMDPFAMLYRGDKDQRYNREWSTFLKKWTRPAAFRSAMRDKALVDREVK